jgi:uncharacterized RDD family membrane protein YckC
MSTQRLQDVRLRTPEGVAFSFRLATPLLRLLAMLVDNACVAAAWSAVSVLFSLLNVVSGDVAAAAAIVGYFVLSNGYTIATEWRWQGQTFGKRILRLRVVDERGLPLSFSQVAIRNLLRFIDSLPAAYAVGGVVALLNTRGQRLGDIAAGTLVIWEPPVEAPDLSALRGEKYNTLRGHPAVVARLRHAVAPAEARVAWQALARRDQLEPSARLDLFAELATLLRSKTRIPEELLDGISDEQFVRNVVDVLYISRT